MQVVILVTIQYSLNMQQGRDLEHQISNRISSQSPTKYDMDFYRRKVNRLQNDCNSLQDDLNKARMRLRRAQDYELKYELILKQNTNLQNELDRKEKELNQKKSQLENVKLQVNSKSQVGEDWTKQKIQLQRQIEKWKVKHEQAEQKRISFMLQNRQKSQLNQKRELQGLKKQFVEKEQGYQFQIRQLKKTLGQKQNIESVINNRVEMVRNQKNEQIRRLQDFIQKQKIANDEAYKQKSEELDKFRDKFQKIFNFQLQNLKKSVDDQDELFNIELNGFREMIGIKNDEVAKLLERLKKQSQEHQKDSEDQQGQINMLRQKIYTIQRQSQLQINNIKQRITKIHASDIESIQKRYNSIIEGLKGERKQFQRQLKQKEKTVQSQKKQLERIKHEMYDRLKQRDVRIQHLQERIKQSSEMNDNQLKNLHQSFHQIQSEKQLMVSQYQTNVGFLTQQYSKLTAKNEGLTSTVKALHQEIVRTKKQYTQLIQGIESRWKEQRKQFDDERQHERQRLQRLQDEIRERQRSFKVKEKQIDRFRQSAERQKAKLQFIIQEMERDTERLNNYIKQLDEALKRELKKNQTSTLDTGSIRRQLNGELQRQKSELEVIMRLETDQMKKKIEVQLTKVMRQNQKLQNDLLQKTLALETLEEEFKKLEHINKNIDKINKDKLIEYEKKMATLNSEINLTQTLYHQFMAVKSRANKQNQ